MDVSEALAALGGAARTRQLLVAGCTPSALSRAVALGQVRSVARGAFALPGARPDAVLAVTVSAGLTCLSALERLELPLPDSPAVPHLAVPRNFKARAYPDVRARWHYLADRPIPGGVSHVVEALDAAGGCLDPTWHLVAVDAALNRGLITLGDLMTLRRSTRERREFLLKFADGRAEAPGETIARLMLVQGGLAVRPQAYIDGAGHVDIEVEGLVIVQVDGYGPHSGKVPFRRDREKGRAVIKAGRPLLSYAASELLGRSRANVVQDVRDALEMWRQRDERRVVPAGPRTVTVQRDGSGTHPAGA